MNALERAEHKISLLKQDLSTQRESLMQIQLALDLQILDEVALVWNSQDVNDWNLNQYSRALEDKINDILTVA